MNTLWQHENDYNDYNNVLIVQKRHSLRGNGGSNNNNNINDNEKENKVNEMEEKQRLSAQQSN